MGMTSEDEDLLKRIAENANRYFPDKHFLKTIYPTFTEEMVKKIIDLEAETFRKNNPDYVFVNVTVESKQHGTVTYKLHFSHVSKLVKNATVN
jgi:hypothetical protein